MKTHTGLIIVCLFIGSTWRANAADLRISATQENDSAVQIQYEATTNDYYILMSSDSLETLENPVIVTKGKSGIGTMTDTNYGSYAESSHYYRVLEVPITKPRDSDGDQIDDCYELKYGFLNPLNPADAENDEDEDGVSNRSEYDRGTLPDSSASSSTTLYVNATTGTNSNDGLAPIATDLHGPKAEIQAAAEAAYNDDMIEIAAGSYHEATLEKNATLSLMPIGNVMLMPEN